MNYKDIVSNIEDYIKKEFITEEMINKANEGCHLSAGKIMTSIEILDRIDIDKDQIEKDKKCKEKCSRTMSRICCHICSHVETCQEQCLHILDEVKHEDCPGREEKDIKEN